jgi:glycosyltransferase involved in cell wall biosynthesis
VVSVVLPVRNAAATVGRALASIHAQTLAEWELVVVDDGSTDGTADVVRAWEQREPRLRVLRRPAEGVVAASNAGLAVARGRFIARMDADDEARPERLAAQADFLADPAQAATGVVSSLVDYGGDRTANAGYALHVDWVNSLVTPEAIALNRFIELPLAHPSVMFRRDLVERWGGYLAGDFPEDYELVLRWLDAGVRMAKVPRVLLRWNDPPGRLSRTDPRYSPEAFFRTKAKWIARELARLDPQADGSPRPVWVWGAGRPTRKRAAYLGDHGVRIAAYVDVDGKKVTRALGGSGVPVRAPAELPEPGRVFVLGYVSTRGARDLIRADLLRRGYGEGRDFLMCA